MVSPIVTSGSPATATISPGPASSISTRSMPTSSSAQPVTAIEPCSPVAPAAGVSTTPLGGADVPGSRSVAVIVEVVGADPV